MVVLIRPIFIEVCPLDEALKLRWIASPFFFSFELSYQREPRSLVWTGSRGLLVSSLKNFLQCPPFLFRMVVRRLE